MKDIVSAEWLFEHLYDDNIIVLDCSLEAPVSGSVDSSVKDMMIPDAVFFDLKNDFSDQNSDLPNMMPAQEDFNRECCKLGIRNDHKIILYDNINLYSAPRVWWMFKAMGHKDVAVLNGGVPYWYHAGYPLERKKLTAMPLGNFKGSFDRSAFRDAAFVLQNIENTESVLIDARAADRFSGEKPEPRAGLRSGHIPNSLNIPYASLLDENGLLKSETLLKQIFKNIATDQKEMIFSCGSGLTACIVLLAAEQLFDNPKSVYDGSWTEWGQNQDLPVSQSGV